MSTHVVADAAVTATPTTDPRWLTLSAAFTDEAPMITDREDLMVTVAPGAGHGSPACFLPAHAHIEVDSACLGRVNPATITPHVPADRARYAAGWGAFTHECGHAAHSRWDAPTLAHPGHVEAAMLLEESRMEAAHVRRRPDDRHWLRACVNKIVRADTGLGTAAAPSMTRHDAAHTAGLLLARVDAGILTRRETAAVTREVRAILGEELLGQLRGLWREAHKAGDTDADTMLDIGRRWHDLVGPQEPPAGPGTPGTGAPGTPVPGAEPSPLAAAIGATLGAVARAVAREPLPEDPADTAARARAAESAAASEAERAAARVFGEKSGTGGAPAPGPHVTGTRTPREDERAAARVLARALTPAGVRDRAVAKTTSAVPPGRVRMRGVLAAAAQRAAGAIPTAEPFVRTTRTAVPMPPLRVGIACDVSGSMAAMAAPVASAAWILTNAAHHTRVPADTATVLFGAQVHPITRPGITPAAVTEWRAAGGEENIPTAIDALDAALGLSRPGAARLLIVISDGKYYPHIRTAGQTRADRLRAAGCGLLWLTTNEADVPFTGATVVQLTNPATAARDIGRAATAALRATH